MNTRNFTIPYLRPDEKYIFCNDELELAFEENDLKEITDKWNRGYDIELIAKQHKRDPDEIFLAIFHQARKNKITRKINARKPEVVHLKIKKDVPTVIEYEGNRYILDHKYAFGRSKK